MTCKNLFEFVGNILFTSQKFKTAAEEVEESQNPINDDQMFKYPGIPDSYYGVQFKYYKVAITE